MPCRQLLEQAGCFCQEHALQLAASACFCGTKGAAVTQGNDTATAAVTQEGRTWLTVLICPVSLGVGACAGLQAAGIKGMVVVAMC